MSSPITPTIGAIPIRLMPSAGANAPLAESPRSAPVAAPPAVALDTLPSSPPPEVLAQMESAARTYEELSRQGRELRFARDAHSGRTRIEVRDREGNVLTTLSPAQALAVAAGAPLQ